MILSAAKIDALQAAKDAGDTGLKWVPSKQEWLTYEGKRLRTPSVFSLLSDRLLTHGHGRRAIHWGHEHITLTISPSGLTQLEEFHAGLATSQI